MKIATIELYQDNLLGKSKNYSLFNAIVNNKNRSKLATTALRNTPDDVIVVFPGWTFSGSPPPEFMNELSKKVLVVFECIDKNFIYPQANKVASDFVFGWKTYVMGKSIISPVCGNQKIASGYDKGHRTKMDSFYKELSARNFCMASTNQNGLLLICGEVVSLNGGGNKGYNSVIVPDEFQVALPEKIDLVVNPGHTPEFIGANTHKRMKLSENGILCYVANCFNGNTYINGAHQASRVFMYGEKKQPISKTGNLQKDGYRICKYDLTL